MTESFHHDRIMILDEQNRPVYGYDGEGRIAARRSAGDLAAVTPLVRQVRGGRNVSPRITDAAYTAGATEGTIRDAATAAAPPRWCGSATMASSPRRWRSRRRWT